MIMGCDRGWRYDLFSWRCIPRGAALDLWGGGWIETKLERKFDEQRMGSDNCGGHGTL